MKTFTTYAEKKAKQFLNLLQGYTKGIRITAVLILLLMGVGNAWGYTISSAKIYYDDSNSKWGSNVVVAFDKNDGGAVFAMTKINNTSLHYWTGSWGSGSVSYMRFGKTDKTYDWYGWWTDVKSTWDLSTKDSWSGVSNGWGLDINNAYKMFGAESNSSGANLTKTDLTSYTDLNYTQTVQQYLSTDEGNNYAASTEALATVKVSSYQLNSKNTTTSSSGTIASGSSSATCSAARTATVTYTVTDVKSGYTFVGWYDGNTQKSTETTFEAYQATEAKTITARFKENTYSYTVTAGEGGTVSPASGTVAQGSGVTIEATPNVGYEFVKWTATNGTLADASSASTTFTPSANNANATASFKVADCTQTPTTPTSLTAKVGGNELVGDVCSGTDVILTAGGTISVGSLQWGTGTVGENIITAENGRSSITVSPTVTTTYWVRSIITEAGVCYGETSEAKTLQINITPALVQPVLSKSTLTLEEGGSTGSITVTSGTTGGTWKSSDLNVATVNNGTVTPKGPGTATITYTVSNACEADKIATCTVTINAKPYYIGGRFQQKWNDGSSTSNPFTYAGNGRYKLETHKTVAELSAQITEDYGNRDQFFFIHTGKGKAGTSTYPFWTTKNEDGSGHNFEAHIGESNAIELGRQETNWGSIVENRLMKFTDATDNSSDVVIWWEPSTNKLWYTATANLTTNLYLLGLGSSNWTVNDSRRFVKDENDPTKAKVTITLAKGEYTEDTNDGFKINDNVAGKWYGNDGTMTRGNCIGWSFKEGTGNAGLTADVAGDYVFTLDLTTMKLTVTYPEAYRVTYGVGTNKGTTSVTTDPSVTSGDLVLAATEITFSKGDTKAGYKWKNWNSKADGTGANLGTGETYFSSNRAADITVYACYDLVTYNITYNLNGGSGTMTPTSYTITTTTFNLPTPSKTGYTFAGWFDNEELTGDAVTQITKGTTGDKTFYAKWTAIEYTITYNDLYGVTHSNPETYTIESETITFTPPTSTRTGYDFAGWNPTEITKGSTGNKNVTAQWTEILSTITITTNPAEGGNVTVDDEPFTPGNTVQVGVATSKKVTAVPNPGYGVATWTVSSNDIVRASGSETVTLKADGSGREGTLCANFVGLEYTITFNKQNGIGGTEKASVNYKDNNYSVDPVEVPNRTGYTFGGYYTEANGAGVQVVSAEGAWLSNATGYTDAEGKWLVHENTTLYAQWTANTYTVTLQHSTIAGYGSVGTSSVTATYDADMPSATMPTAANGYVFMGYFDGEQGAGTQYYNADGTSAHVWDKAEDATLYAHFVKAEITQITLDKYTFELVEAGGTGFVTATPTIEPTPTGTVTLCWRLLYNSGNPVAGRDAQVVSGDTVKFSIAGLAAGTYKIKAVLRAGNNCGSGEVLSTKTVNFSIASTYTITVRYTCDGKEIAAPAKVSASVTEETGIKAPDITGYTFSSWEAGDGVTIESAIGDSVNITAIYDGYLTAKYTARPMVYFKNTLGWEKVYVYTFSDNAWWNDGTGVHPATNKLEQGEMTQIGESDVYYFELDKPDSDYTQDNNANPNYIAFSNKDMRTENGAFWECDAIYRGDHKAELTLFVPQKDQTPETHNKTKYYSKGIWMKYNSTESGYQLPGTIPNDDPDHDGWGTYGNKFTAQTPGGYTFSITKYLEANTEYTFKIKNYVWVKDYNNTDNNQWFGYDGTINNSTTNWLHFKGDNDEGKNNGDAKIKTTAEGEYTFTIDLSQGKVLLSVEYPIEVGDYRVIYKDNAIWSQGTAHNANWYHPSRIIKKNKTAEPTKDIISFFISYGQNTKMQFQRVKSITNGNVTWENAGEVAKIPDAVNEAGVYNFIVTQTANGASISMENSAEPYTGNYYIRVDALAGKWDNYKTNPENRMTYSAFSESEANSFGDKYSHYATKYCDEGTNIKFVIANDYSPCISDTLAQDVKVNGANPFDNLDEHGTIKSNYQQNKANVRFMWNHKTNKISRVYIGSASETERHFLVLKSDKEMKGEDGKNLQNEGDDHAKHKAVFKDTQNWMYERTIKVQPGTRVKLYACYPMDNDDIDAAEQKAQHFRGAYDGNTWNDNNSVVILGGEGDNWNKIRIIYDFKTNRLMAALVPDQEVSGEKTIAADVMIIRKHQDAATSITLTNDNSKLKEVKTVYGSLQLNRWVLNNRNSEKSGIEYCTKKVNNQDTYDENVTNEHHPVLSPGEQKSIYERALYFISFPFDVHLSDVFGFGTYGTHWVISDYNGLRRAQRGYFAEDCINEDCTNWDYIWDPSNFTLKANQGYLLSLDLDLMRYDNTDFWLHNIDQVELFFPSTANLETIEKTSYTMPALGEEYLCKINHNTDGTTPDRDRRVKDSYWRCIGVPSFADYDGSLYKSKEDAEADQYPINWNTDYTWTADESGFPFLYEWNVTDNSLSVQNTSAYQFKPTFAYLVQNGGAIHWKAVNSKPSSVIARQRTETARNYEWKIALMRDGNQEDQTFVRITDNENVTTEFDFNQDLAKEFNYGRGDIYTLIGYERVAANSMPCSDKTTIIPLGLNIEQAGDYTIAMPEGVENIGITLVDNETGIHTNLSAGQEYTLILNNGICENRLFIEVSPIQNTPTDLEYTTRDTREQTTRKMLIDGMLYLIRDGVIYDAQGHRR